MNWLIHILGLNDPSGYWYLWWSGFGANFQEFAMAGAVVLYYRKHNCHVKPCWRLGRHSIEGTAYVVCRKHHPEDHLTMEHVLKRYREVKNP